MDRATRDKFAARTSQQDLTSGTACWETAPEIFDQLNKDFGPFDVDLTADADRALCDTWLGPGGERFGLHGHNALLAPWHQYGTSGYSNPPYGAFIAAVLEKAVHERTMHDVSSTFLLPMRVTKAFQRYVLKEADELYFCDSRLIFYENGKPRYSTNKHTGKLNDRPDTAMFDSIIVRYLAHTLRSTGGPLVDIWKVPPHGTAPSRRRAAVLDKVLDAL